MKIVPSYPALPYIGENYRVVTGYEKQVNLALKRGVNRGVLLQVRGMGASGSFKINKDGANGRATVVKVNWLFQSRVVE